MPSVVPEFAFYFLKLTLRALDFSTPLRFFLNN